MPVYEYRCNNCHRRISVFVRSFSATASVICTNCGSGDLQRLISRFAFHRSEESRLEDLADPSKFGDLDESDPRSQARWMRKMGEAMGEDLGDEFHQMVDEMEAGETSSWEGGPIPDAEVEDAGDGFDEDF